MQYLSVASRCFCTVQCNWITAGCANVLSNTSKHALWHSIWDTKRARGAGAERGEETCGSNRWVAIAAGLASIFASKSAALGSNFS
eukprot:7384808-Pyramimonas_sp.AAC.1